MDRLATGAVSRDAAWLIAIAFWEGASGLRRSGEGGSGPVPFLVVILLRGDGEQTGSVAL